MPELDANAATLSRRTPLGDLNIRAMEARPYVDLLRYDFLTSSRL
jgi:hypothetical protein